MSVLMNWEMCGRWGRWPDLRRSWSIHRGTRFNSKYISRYTSSGGRELNPVLPNSKQECGNCSKVLVTRRGPPDLRAAASWQAVRYVIAVVQCTKAVRVLSTYGQSTLAGAMTLPPPSLAQLPHPRPVILINVRYSRGSLVSYLSRRTALFLAEF
jgi:hypothetical protein